MFGTSKQNLVTSNPQSDQLGFKSEPGSML